MQDRLDAAEVSAGYLHKCARLTDGSVRCWGYDSACPAPAGADAGVCSATGSCGDCGAVGEVCCVPAESTRIPYYCSVAGASCNAARQCVGM